MRRSAAAAVIVLVAFIGVACSDDHDVAALADVCTAADLDFVTAWFGPAFADDESSTNACRYRAEDGSAVEISARRVDGGATVTARLLYAEPEYAPVDIPLMSAYLEELVYDAPRTGPTIAERLASLGAFSDDGVLCSYPFSAHAGGASVRTYVSETDGVRRVGGLILTFPAATVSADPCDDTAPSDGDVTTTVPVEPHTESWPATYTGLTLDAPPGNGCGLATLHLTGVTVFPPDGTTVDLGDVTMTNSNWMIEPPSECRRS